MYSLNSVHVITLIIVVSLTFTSCESFVDKGELTDKEDQIKVDNLLSDITKENYSDRISEISFIYANRFKEIGIESKSSEFILNEVYEVWPKKLEKDREEIVSSFDNFIYKYRETAKKQKYKNQNKSALKILIQSEKVDTTFSDLIKRYLEEVDSIFKTKDNDVKYYISALELLESKYKSYNLDQTEFAIIVGIGSSVKSNLKFFKGIEESIALKSGKENFTKAGVINALAFLQYQRCYGPEAEKHYTDINCEFAPNWEEIGLALTLGTTSSMLGSTIRMGYYAYASTVFPAGAAAAAATDYVYSAAWGGGSGAVIEITRQLDVHNRWITEQELKGNI